ncbi:SpaH/EbpB family LPXTG-anchored major pilin [Gardnerella vaginalis]|uniref:SpaH/EbpB family LPXTG-anchored major pilin n=1 Tax=Gardnerella vaginalis TaxID=2702 RepID=UPI001FF51E70
MNKFTKQCVAAMASLAMAGTLCVAGAVVAGSSAWAVDGTACDASKAPWDQTNKSCTGTIKITKQDDSTKSALSGAVFTAEKVTAIDGANVDLSTRDGWDALAKKVAKLNKSATATTEDATITYGTAKEETTADGTGVATFKDLSIGVYRIKEKTPPAGYTSDVVPFFMTVPEITRDKSSTNNKYTYDVSVTPKNHNVKDAISKTADTKNMVGVGDELPYTITATPNKTKATNLGDDGQPKDLTADDLKQYAIFDDALTAAYTSVGVDTVTEVKVDGVDAALTKGANKDDANADYYVTSEANTKDATRTRISVVFLKNGLEKIIGQLNAADAATKNPKVHVTFKFKIAETVPTGSDNKLMNKYGFIPGGKDGENHDPIEPDSHTDTEFRKFHIFKYDGTTEKGTEAGKDNRKPLKDAKFKVFAGAVGDDTKDTAALAAAQKCADDPSNEDNCKTALTGFSEKSTDDKGVTPDYIAKVGQKFYIVETSAPDKYARSTKVYPVTVESAAQKTDGNDTPAYVVDIANVPTKDGGFWFNLPKTGAAGVVIFALAGVCLVCFGIFVFMRNRKKDEEQQAA